MTFKKKPFENIVGIRENAGNQHFSHFPTMFFDLQKTDFSFSVTFILSSANAFLLFGEELKRVKKMGQFCKCLYINQESTHLLFLIQVLIKVWTQGAIVCSFLCVVSFFIAYNIEGGLTSPTNCQP